MITVINRKFNVYELASEDESKIHNTFNKVLNTIHKYNWKGACHSSSSLLYILLKEHDVNVSLCTGWVRFDKAVFGHSWVEYNGLPIDAAISLANVQSFPPVLLGEIIGETEEFENNYEYGYSRNIQLEAPMDNFSNKPLGEYLESFPEPLRGLFNEVYEQMNLLLNFESLKEKYFYSHWIIKN